MALANQEAQRLNHETIDTQHILLGLVKEGLGVGARVLKNLGVDFRKVREEVQKLVGSEAERVDLGKLPQTPRAKRVIEYAIAEARDLNHNYVGTEHLLLGLLREQDGVAAQVLRNLGLDLDKVRREILALVGTGGNASFLHVATAHSEKGTLVRSFFAKGVAGSEFQRLLDELEARKSQAVARGDYELAAEYLSVANDMKRVLDRLDSLLSREPPPQS